MEKVYDEIYKDKKGIFWEKLSADEYTALASHNTVLLCYILEVLLDIRKKIGD